MTYGNAYVVAEFVLIDRRGKISQQKSVTGYSHIGAVNTESQKEVLYENALNHARSKYLASVHKPTDTETDFAVVNSGFKTYTLDNGEYTRPKLSKMNLRAKDRHKVEERFIINTENKIRELDKMQTKNKWQEELYGKKDKAKVELKIIRYESKFVRMESKIKRLEKQLAREKKLRRKK